MKKKKIMATLLYSATIVAMAAAFQHARVEAEELTQVSGNGPQAELVTTADDQVDDNVGMTDRNSEAADSQPIEATTKSVTPEMAISPTDTAMSGFAETPAMTSKEDSELVSETDETSSQSVVTNEETTDDGTTRGIVRSADGQALVDLSTDKGSYRPGEDIKVYADIKNTTDTDQTITVKATISHLAKEVVTQTFKTFLSAGQTYRMTDGDLTFSASDFQDNHGYLMSVSILDATNQAIGHINRAIAVESEWTKFPRYAVVSANNDAPYKDSISAGQIDSYQKALEKLKNMNINSYFYYDVYNSPTDPFPDKDTFVQVWNTWNHPTIDTKVIKTLTKQAKEAGAVNMLYNMILAEAVDENGKFPNLLNPSELVYNNYESGEGYFGKNGEPMTYTVNGKPFQRYYSPYSKEWQTYIAKVMVDAMERGGFDGWQGDTIGDTDVTEYHQTSGNRVRLSDGYDDFLNGVKDLLKSKDGKDYYLTLNDVNGEHISTLKDAKQDVVYDELWTSGNSAIPGRQQTEYGDLKARIDEVRAATGKSLIVAAYMVEPNRDGLSDEEREAIRGNGYMNQDALLLTTATISAAGGYHMSSAASAGDRNADGIGVLQTAFYPNQQLIASQELNRKVNDYNQFVTAYENILRDGVENDDAMVNTLDHDGKVLSWDKQGINGHQVWTYAKQGDGFRTIHMINLMDINSDWKNERGWQDQKNPTRQEKLTVRYELNDFTMAEAERMAKNTYLTSPDDWSKSDMVKATVRVEAGDNGKPVMIIDVPKLELWNMIYIDKAEPIYNTYQSEDGQELAASSRTESEKVIDGYQLVGSSIRENGMDYIYRKVVTVIPSDSPSLDLPSLSIDTYKTEDGQELAVSSQGEKAIDGYVVVSTVIRQDGTDYIYRKIETSTGKAEAPTVSLPMLSLDTYKTEDGQDLAVAGNGRKYFYGYELVSVTSREDGNDYIYRPVSVGVVPSDAPVVELPMASLDTYKTEDGQELAAPAIGEKYFYGYELVSKMTREDGIDYVYRKLVQPTRSVSENDPTNTKETNDLVNENVPVMHATAPSSQQETLPNTGDANGFFAALGFLGLAGIEVFAKRKKKHDN